MKRRCLDCNKITDRPRCPGCQKVKNRRKNSRRSTTVRDRARKQLRINGGNCYLCKAWFPSTSLILDHVLALADGGKDTHTNLAPVCKPCHHSKTQAENKKRRR